MNETDNTFDPARQNSKFSDRVASGDFMGSGSPTSLNREQSNAASNLFLGPTSKSPGLPGQ